MNFSEFSLLVNCFRLRDTVWKKNYMFFNNKDDPPFNYRFPYLMLDSDALESCSISRILLILNHKKQTYSDFFNFMLCMMSLLKQSLYLEYCDSVLRAWRTRKRQKQGQHPLSFSPRAPPSRPPGENGDKFLHETYLYSSRSGKFREAFYEVKWFKCYIETQAIFRRGRFYETAFLLEAWNQAAKSTSWYACEICKVDLSFIRFRSILSILALF